MFWRGGVSSEMLAELRAIRGELSALHDALASKPNREELADYVTLERYEADRAGETRRENDWRYWAPFVFAVVWGLVAKYIHIG